MVCIPIYNVIGVKNKTMIVMILGCDYWGKYNGADFDHNHNAEKADKQRFEELVFITVVLVHVHVLLCTHSY